MAKIRVIKQQGGFLRGSLQCDVDLLQKWHVGEILEGDFKKKRNSQFHRKFFALLGVVFDNQEEYDLFEPMRKAIIMQCGYYIEVKTLTGKITYEAKSINFAEMDELDFTKLYEKAIDVSIKYLMNGADQYEIKANVEKVLSFA